jgi:hypothetical protein
VGNKVQQNTKGLQNNEDFSLWVSKDVP